MRKYYASLVVASICLLTASLTTIFRYNSQRQRIEEMLETMASALAYGRLSRGSSDEATDDKMSRVRESPALTADEVTGSSNTTRSIRSHGTQTMATVLPQIGKREQLTVLENETARVLENQRVRQELVTDFCTKPKRRNSIRSRGVLRHTMHSDNARFAYCEIGKVASSSWRHVLQSALGDNRGRRESDMFKPLRHVPQDDRHFKFFFVRHPFDRLISAYFNKFDRRSEYWKQTAPRIIRQFRTSNSTDRRVSFDEFIRYLVSAPLTHQRDDFHWSPQTMMCQPCRVRFDFIGHYETLYEDAEYVLRRIGLDDRIKFPVVDPKKLRLNVERIRTMFGNATRQQIDRLKLIYRPDFEMFGYDPVI